MVNFKIKVTSYLKEREIHQIFAQNETKSNYSERAIQILKNRMYRMFTERQSYKFIDNLQDIVKSVNDTPSRPLGDVAPSSVNKDNEDEIRFNSYLIRTKTKLSPNRPRVKKEIKKSRKRRRPVFKFKINDKVRITYLRHPFRRDTSRNGREKYLKCINVS